MMIKMLKDYSLVMHRHGSVSDVKQLVAGNILDCPDDSKAIQLIREGFAEETEEVR